MPKENDLRCENKQNPLTYSCNSSYQIFWKFCLLAVRFDPGKFQHSSAGLHMLSVRCVDLWTRTKPKFSLEMGIDLSLINNLLNGRFGREADKESRVSVETKQKDRQGISRGHLISWEVIKVLRKFEFRANKI